MPKPSCQREQPPFDGRLEALRAAVLMAFRRQSRRKNSTSLSARRSPIHE